MDFLTILAIGLSLLALGILWLRRKRFPDRTVSDDRRREADDARRGDDDRRRDADDRRRDHDDARRARLERWRKDDDQDPPQILPLRP